MNHLQEHGAPAVARALDLLEILGRSAEGMTLTELSRQLEIPKSSTHYLIHTLAARGYLQQIPWTRQYILALRRFGIKSKSLGKWQSRNFFSPRIRALSDRMCLGAQISTLEGDEGIVIDRIDGRPVPSNTRRGHHFRLHCTASGKVLIAWLPDSELRSRFPDRILTKFTPKTIADFDQLRVQLADARKKRYAVSDEEWQMGRRAVAAPIFDSNQNVIAALSMDGSIGEIPSGKFSDIADELLEVADQITTEIVTG